MDDLEQMRENVIRKIEAAFPKNPPAKNVNKWKLARDTREYEGRFLEEKLRGKRWNEVIETDGLQYWFTDVDFLWTITPKAFLYYLPAFLTSSVNRPDFSVLHSTYFSAELSNSAEQMSIEQIETIIAYFEFQTLYFQKEQKTVWELEDMTLQWMLILDKKKAEGGKNEKL